MTGPLYCCSFMAQRRTALRLKPLRLGDEIAREQLRKEVENAGIEIRFVAPRLRQGPVEIAPIGLGRLAGGVDTGPVDGEAGDDLAQRPRQDVAGENRRCAGSAARPAPRRGRATLSSLAISFAIIRSFDSRTIAAKGCLSPVNST
jgi:hypothetical protein